MDGEGRGSVSVSTRRMRKKKKGCPERADTRRRHEVVSACRKTATGPPREPRARVITTGIERVWGHRALCTYRGERTDRSPRRKTRVGRRRRRRPPRVPRLSSSSAHAESRRRRPGESRRGLCPSGGTRRVRARRFLYVCGCHEAPPSSPPSPRSPSRAGIPCRTLSCRRFLYRLIVKSGRNSVAGRARWRVRERRERRARAVHRRGRAGRSVL